MLPIAPPAMQLAISTGSRSRRRYDWDGDLHALLWYARSQTKGLSNMTILGHRDAASDGVPTYQKRLRGIAYA
jgi:hypothetical protein